MRIGVSDPAWAKIHHRIVEIAYLVIVVSSGRNDWHDRAPRIGAPAEGQMGNAWRILQVKQDEDEWTKGSLRQMKDEGTRYRGREARGKREMG